MNDATKRRIRRELAERMHPNAEVYLAESECWVVSADGRRPGDAWEEGDTVELRCFNPFTNHADCAALVEWLAGQNEAIQHKFVTCLMDALTGEGWHMVSRGSGMSVHHIMKVLASPLEVRVLAACAALGIDTSDQ